MEQARLDNINEHARHACQLLIGWWDKADPMFRATLPEMLSDAMDHARYVTEEVDKSHA